MRSTQDRHTTQDPAIRGFNERNNFMTIQVDWAKTLEYNAIQPSSNKRYVTGVIL
jgi:hypothetical protein